MHSNDKAIITLASDIFSDLASLAKTKMIPTRVQVCMIIFLSLKYFVLMMCLQSESDMFVGIVIVLYSHLRHLCES